MGKKILIVDDAGFIRILVKDILIPKGYEIAGEVVNGREAVAKYEELKPDLVTMDITMKEKDGLDAARDILNRHPEARIIMVIALGQERILMESIKLGVKDFVVKPFEPTRIISAVEKSLA